MRYNIAVNRLEAVLLLQLFAVEVYIILANAHVCDVGRGRDETDLWNWVLPYDKPCLCTKMVMGGMNTWTPIGPFKPIYVKSPLFSDNVTKTRRHKMILCEEEVVNITKARKENPTQQTTINMGVSMETIKMGPMKQDKASPTERAKQETTMSRVTSLEETTIITSLETTTSSEDVSVTTPMAISMKQATEEDSTSSVTLSTAEDGCVPIPLGIQSGDIPDLNITASSYKKHWDFDREPGYARLGSDRFWSSPADPAPWIQVDLGSIRRVTALLTEGNSKDGYYQYWVEQIKVQVGMVVENLIFIAAENGKPKIFDANIDAHNVAEIIVDATGIPTRFVRIYPNNCVRAGYQSVACLLRFEIVGC